MLLWPQAPSKPFDKTKKKKNQERLTFSLLFQTPKGYSRTTKKRIHIWIPMHNRDPTGTMPELIKENVIHVFIKTVERIRISSYAILLAS